MEQKETQKKEVIKCCICNKDIKGHGNNPRPYKDEGVCCNECNLKYVIPTRIGQTFGSKKQ